MAAEENIEALRESLQRGQTAGLTTKELEPAKTAMHQKGFKQQARLRLSQAIDRSAAPEGIALLRHAVKKGRAADLPWEELRPALAPLVS